MQSICVIVFLEDMQERKPPLLNVTNDVKSIHAYIENLAFPVFIYTKNAWEETQLTYLNQNYIHGNYSTLSLAQWCQSHQIYFQILYPKNKLKLLIKNPRRFFYYRYLKKLF